MSRSVDEFLNRVSEGLYDPSNVTWSKDELLSFLLDGLGELLKYAPDQFTDVTTVTLVAGAQQTLPTNGVMLIRPVRRTADGRALRRSTPRAMDKADPGWRALAESASVITVVYDADEDPQTFWVYPPAIASTQIDLLLVNEPADIDIGDDLPVDQKYFGALSSYVMYRALSKDHDYAIPGGRAEAYYTAFLQKVGADGGSQ